MKRKLQSDAARNSPEEDTETKKAAETEAGEEDSNNDNHNKNSGSNGAKGKHSGSKKKKKMNPIGKLPDTQSTKEQLLHKNRELAVKARRLREKLKAANQHESQVDRKAQTFDSALSCITRALDTLLTEGLALLGQKLDVKLDPTSSGFADTDKASLADLDKKPKNGEEFARLLLARPTQKLYARQVADAVSNFKDEDDDDDDSNPDQRLLDLPELVDKEITRKTKLAMALLRTIVEKLLGVGANADREKAVQTLLGTENGSNCADARIKLRSAEERCKLYADRVLQLEMQIRKAHNQVEDAELNQRTWMHRLAAVCTESINEGTFGATVDALKERGAIKSDVGGDTSANRTTKESNHAESQDAAEAAAEASETEKIAAARLKEIEQIQEEKSKLIDELENLRAAVQVNPELQAIRNGTTPDPRIMEELQKEVHRLQSHLDQTIEAERKEREMVQTMRQNMASLEMTTAQTLAQRTDDFALKVRELEEQLVFQRGELQQAQVEHERLELLEKQLHEYKLIAQTRQTELKAAQDELRVLRENPVAKYDETLRSRLEEAAKGQWPEDEEKRTAAQLRTELEASRAELTTTKESLATVLQDLEATTSAFPEIEAQKERILHEIKAMQEASAEKSNRFIRLDEEYERAKKDLRLKVKERDEIRRALEEFDEQYRILQEQYDATEEARVRSDEHSRTTYAIYLELAHDREAIKNRLDDVEAESNGLRTKIQELENANVGFRKAKEEAEHLYRRSSEQIKKLKSRLERSRSIPSMDPSDLKSDVELRLSAMENALRCPLRSEYWRDAVINKCGHTFSKKALYDNLEKRNRKCPHCKALYNKSDVLDMIPPYQKNDYDD